MKLFDGLNDISGNEPTNANAPKLPEAEERSVLPSLEKEETLPLVQLDFIDAVEKLHPGFLAWYAKEGMLQRGSGHDVERMLLTAGLFHRLLGSSSVLRVVFYAGYLQGQKDERKRMDDLFAGKLD